jgi:capsular exopolysaccharide synthesis family protein
MDDSVKTKDDLTRAVPTLPVLGLISTVDGWRDAARPVLVSVEAPNSPAAESYRSLRTSMQFVGVQRAPRIIQITSAHPGEGKTATVSNLGVALARSGQRTLLVDCDLRRGRLHTFFGLDNEVGFTSLFLGEATPASAARAVPDVKNLSVVTCGPPPPNPSELLSDKRTGEALSSLLDTCDVILVDCPPVLPVADAAALSVWVEATVFVVSSGVTRRPDVQRAVEVLLQGDAPLVGTVLNNVRPHDEYAYVSSYYTDNAKRLPERRLRSLRRDAAAG